MAYKKFSNYRDYRKEFSHLVELERKEEMQQHENEIKKLTGLQREKKGRALMNMKGKYQGKGLGSNHIVKFTKSSSSFSNKGYNKIPEVEISVGDLVMLSKDRPLDKKNPTGTVIEKTNFSISVAFNDPPEQEILKKGIRIDLYVNDITYQRMLDSLNQLDKAKGRQRYIREILLGNCRPVSSQLSSETDVSTSDSLNTSQKKAVIESLKAKDLFLIHGPPGTGKTTTLIEAINKHVDKGNKVLASAASNIAVDNMVDFLTKKGKKVVRVGHPARVTENLRKHTLDFLIEDKDKFKEATKLRNQASEINEKQKSYPFPSQGYRRGLSDNQLKELAEKNKSSRGLSPKIIQRAAKWIKLQDQRSEIMQQAKDLEKEAVEEIIKQADVVCTTNTGAGGEFISEKTFDTIAVDEATQSTEPSCLIPITRISGKGKVIMAGDHKQLPPTILSQKAESEGLDKTMFQRLVSLFQEEQGIKIKSLLETQYRMNKKIMCFPNEEFYQGRLKAADSVAEHKLGTNIKKLPSKTPKEIKNSLEPEKIVTFIDTSEKNDESNYREESPSGTPSKQNQGEAKIVEQIVSSLLSLGINKNQIGIISPYEAQISLLKREMGKTNESEETKDLEIKTVDGFQGREKDVIVLSLVRSNNSGNIGFLSDLRRLNVSITRARKKLILVGDSSTLKNNETYKSLIEYIENKKE